MEIPTKGGYEWRVTDVTNSIRVSILYRMNSRPLNSESEKECRGRRTNCNKLLTSIYQLKFPYTLAQGRATHKCGSNSFVVRF